MSKEAMATDVSTSIIKEEIVSSQFGVWFLVSFHFLTILCLNNGCTMLMTRFFFLILYWLNAIIGNGYRYAWSIIPLHPVDILNVPVYPLFG